MALKTMIVAPDAELLSRASLCAERFRRGEYRRDGLPDVRKTHRDAVWLLPPDEDTGKHTYEIHVWGDPAGHVRAYAFRLPK